MIPNLEIMNDLISDKTKKFNSLQDIIKFLNNIGIKLPTYDFVSIQERIQDEKFFEDFKEKIKTYYLDSFSLIQTKEETVRELSSLLKGLKDKKGFEIEESKDKKEYKLNII
jgi:vacuolar-type H+-ATPase subunit I/STV1